MPSCSKSKNPNGVEIVFTEDDHSYRSIVNGRELLYKSVTTFVGDFFPKFDVETMAPLTARKKGLTTEAVKQMWEENRINACKFGTRCHEVCEDTILNRKLRNTPVDTKETLTFGSAIKIASKIRDTIDIIGVEQIVFSEKLKLAGTVDLLGRSRKTGEVLILDWKTNAKIETENKYDQYGFDPISNIPDTNYYHYALQLSTYEVLLKAAGYISKTEKVKRFIIHLTQAGHQFYELPDMKENVIKMIKNSCK